MVIAAVFSGQMAISFLEYFSILFKSDLRVKSQPCFPIVNSGASGSKIHPENIGRITLKIVQVVEPGLISQKYLVLLFIFTQTTVVLTLVKKKLILEIYSNTNQSLT